MSARALERRAREARAWLFEACFPLWAERGLGGRGFLEALDLQHRKVASDLARVRVQARQTYVFTEAIRLGWNAERAGDLVQLGVEILDTACRRPDGLFGRTVDLSTGVLEDDTADLYDIAFALHALAGASGLVSPGADEGLLFPRASFLIEEVSDALEAHLIDPAGGYIESLPRPTHRLQNPHMHLFEASLELYGITKDTRHSKRATQLRDLFLTRFFDKSTGTLGEHFAQDTWAIPTGNAGDIIEPGHQFEWVWLLARYALLMRVRLPEEAYRLYDLACLTLDDEGRAVQSCKRDGTLVDRSRRTWPQTEALKAHVTMWRAGNDAAGVRAVNSFDVLIEEYLTPEGGWVDHYGEDGQVLAGHMPASTGYHVVLAFADLIRAVEA